MKEIKVSEKTYKDLQSTKLLMEAMTEKNLTLSQVIEQLMKKANYIL